MKVKKCSSCQKAQRIMAFYKDKNSKNGRRSICKNCDIKRRIEFRKENIEQERKTARLRYDTQLARSQRLAFEKSHPGIFAEYAKLYRKRMGKKNQERRRNLDKHKRMHDSLYRLRRLTSNRITCAIKRAGYTKQSKTADMLGCSWIAFKKYIESKFQPGMSWDNYGDWHIDHIRPCCSATSIEELERLQHYNNLQPLWKYDNLKKGTKCE